MRHATELFLSLEGFEVTSAASVSEAQAFLSTMQQGDVLITDFHLDGRRTGLDVLMKLRMDYNRDVPAIIMSGDLQSMMRNVKIAIPRCHFLGKPVDTRALLSAIEDLSSYA